MPEICPKCGGNLDYPFGGPKYEDWDKWVEWTPLIGATPELYAALEMCVPVLRQQLDRTGGKDAVCKAMLDNAESALKKARGE